MKNPTDQSKSFLASKTHWANMALAASVELFPPVATFVSTHPQTAIFIVAVLNMAMRQVTSMPLRMGKK